MVFVTATLPCKIVSNGKQYAVGYRCQKKKKLTIKELNYGYASALGLEISKNEISFLKISSNIFDDYHLIG